MGDWGGNVKGYRRKVMRPLFMTMFLVACTALFLWQQVSPASAAASSYSEVEEYIHAQMQAWRVPGVALVIVQDDEIVYVNGFGRADGGGRKVTPDTPFEIGSCSKSFTALAVMQLAEEGKLFLDDTVVKHLPWFGVRDDTHSGSITIRHLLNHTSGLSQSAGTQLMTNLRGLTLQQWVEGLGNTQLDHTPGTAYTYNNLNYMTLALVIEAVSGQTYSAYVEKNIFAPLQMNNSFTGTTAARQAGMSDGHVWWFGLAARSRPSNSDRPDALGAGYLIVSARDLGHYIMAQLNGGVYDGARILSEEGMAKMYQPASLPDGDSPYGFGWVSYRAKDFLTINHNGSSPGFTSSIIMVPERRMGVAVLANTSMHYLNNNLQPAWVMANRVKGMLLWDAPGTVYGEYTRFFRIWNGSFALFSVLILAGLGREIYRWKTGVAPSKSRVSAIAHAVSAVAVLLGLPVAIGISLWLGAFVYMPDAVWWCLLASILLAARAVVSRM